MRTGTKTHLSYLPDQCTFCCPSHNFLTHTPASPSLFYTQCLLQGLIDTYILLTKLEAETNLSILKNKKRQSNLPSYSKAGVFWSKDKTLSFPFCADDLEPPLVPGSMLEFCFKNQGPPGCFFIPTQN